MFTRRLILLFVLFCGGVVALAVRLATFQIAQAEAWSKQATRFVQRHYLIETRRGSILDARGRILACDERSDDLAIDYRAMSLDDRWITQRARARIKAMNIASREERQRRLSIVKEQIVSEIQAIPSEIVHQYDLARGGVDGASVPPLKASDIEERYNGIQKRIQMLKQDQWVRKYDKNDQSDADVDAVDEPEISPVAEEMQVHPIVEDVPVTVRVAIDKILDHLPGVVITPSKRRVYGYGDVAAHLIGVTQSVSESKWRESPFIRPDLLTGEGGDLHGYLPGDRMGSSGVERYCESDLRGMRGVGLRELGGSDIADRHVDAMPGRDVQLTLDIELQKGIQEALFANHHALLSGQEDTTPHDHNVAVVVLRIRDRAVMAMVSTPTFDLNTFQKNVAGLNRDEANRPLLNRAIQNRYPPGSTIKPLEAAAALTEGTLASPETTVLCRGYLYHPGQLQCTGIHGNIALREALEHSCNVFFYTQGRDLGLDRLTDWYSRFGFGTITGLGLGENEGNLPDPAGVRNEETKRAMATQMGIGQGPISVTPLQMANAYATLLEGGMMRAPTLMAGETKEPRRVFSILPEHLRAIRDGMEMVAHGSAGTARSGMLGMSLQIAGKTGSADTELRPVFDDNGNRVYRTQVDADGKPVVDEQGHEVPVYRQDSRGNVMLDKGGKPIPGQKTAAGTDAWFVGYAPMDAPEYVVVVVKEFGGHGGIMAVPVARAAFVQLEKQGYLPNVDAR